MNNTERSFDELKEYLDSEEGKKSLQDFFANIERQKKFYDEQVERFYQKFKHKMPELIEKIMHKYDSNAYVMREYKSGREPMCNLYDVLFSIGKKYGEEVDMDDFEKWPQINIFTSDACVFEGYFMQVMDGQGTVIKIEKLN